MTRTMMQGMWVLMALLGAVIAPPAHADDEAGFTPIFDGKTLDGWDGDPRLWRVEDGCIVGESTLEKPVGSNTFLIYTAGEVGDFELRFDYRITPMDKKSGFANSGVQYRSFRIPDDKNKWRIGGYQADMEAGDTYSGILYGEQFRGILANRGQKTVIESNHKPKVVEQIGDSKEIQTHIKKEDWNSYVIHAEGFHFVHTINGVKTAECTDEDTEQRRATGLLALQLHHGTPMKVEFRNMRIKKLGAPGDAGAAGATGEKKKIVFVPGNPSHGYGSHEHRAGCLLLADQLRKSGLPLDVVVSDGYGYPKDPSIFEGADTVVVYCDGGGGHLLNGHLPEFDALMKKGVGLVCLHYGVETVDGEPGDAFLRWIGGYFAVNWSVNPHWRADYKQLPDHPITRGVASFSTNDEWYYHMRFRPSMEGVTPILTDLPPASSLTRKDGPHEGNPEVRAAVLERHEPQHMAWAYQRGEDYGNGRGFGFTGGHFHWNWGNDQQRKLVLNAIVWTAKMDVPKDGVKTSPVTAKDLEENIDEKQPDHWDSDKIQKQIEEWNGGNKVSATSETATSTQTSGNDKPLFVSPVVTAATPGHAVNVDVDITGAKELYLYATDAGDGIGCDWADWAEPRLVKADGSETKLTTLKWKSATTGHAEAHVDANVEGRPMSVDGKSVPYGIGTHAGSIIAYDLPAGYVRFKATAALDDGGTKQGCGSTVIFAVSNSKDAKLPAAAAITHDPQNELNALSVRDGLQAQLFAAEPMLASPSNIDIDSRGRIWVCEVVNYRHHKGERPEGDRILILEDTNGDGKADTCKVFYQDPEMMSPHGVCVIGSPDGKTNRVIVSCADKVFELIDNNGDDVPDDKIVLFSGISGTQHDHGIHTFLFGPDGKLYFNFGNEGHQLKDKDGKPVVDLAGNVVSRDGKPYREGMVFRCDLDGSHVETLGWDFRNNWMVTVDSFGTLWQSDNDDDGNRGVRINYVMQYGNYGYKDEMTGASWQTKRTNMEEEIPLRHWHQNDPGVVPNLLQTGAGSPTGITVYEGNLLPAVFHNQVIHCDAGPNVVRAYPVENDGAGYKATIENIVTGERDKWFRPSDVQVAPDGSLIVADWYDPGVGGHQARDIPSGRIFRIAPTSAAAYKIPPQDFSTADGAIEALKSPNYATRAIAWQALHAMGDKAEPALTKLWKSDNPRYRARALWLLGKIDGKAQQYVDAALADGDANIRIEGLRLARETGVNLDAAVAKVVHDSSPQVRRDAAIELRFSGSSQADELWAELAMQHDGKDRWYLEALGIGSDLHAESRFAAWLAKVGDKWNTPAGRDIIWRSRADAACDYLAKIVTDPKTPEAEKPRYMRSFDFHKGAAKDKALQSILGL